MVGRSRDDIVLGLPVQLRNADDTGVRSWRWEILDQPTIVGGDALSSPVAAAPVFTPNAAGTYLIRLIVNEGRRGEVYRILVVVRDANGNRVPAAGERNEANWLDAAGVENPRGWQPDMRAMLDAPASGGWREVVACDFTSGPAVDLSSGSEPTVVVDGVTWTSNAGDGQAVVVSFETNGNGLSVEVATQGNMTNTSHSAPHIWTTWAQLLGRNPSPGRQYCLQVQMDGAPTVNGQAIGVALYDQNDGVSDPDVSPSEDEKRLWGAIENEAGTNVVSCREDATDQGWRSLPGGGAANDVAALILLSGASALAAAGDYDDGLPDPGDLAIMSPTWLGQPLGFTTTDYGNPAERVAVFFQSVLGTTMTARIPRFRVLERG